MGKKQLDILSAVTTHNFDESMRTISQRLVWPRTCQYELAFQCFITPSPPNRVFWGEALKTPRIFGGPKKPLKFLRERGGVEGEFHVNFAFRGGANRLSFAIRVLWGRTS